MRQLLRCVLAVVLSFPFALAAQNPEPIRLCVAALENRSHSPVSAEWQQKELIRALERTNKHKEVKKGTAARITAVALESTSGPDAKMQKEGCGFVLYTELVDVQSVGTPRVGTNPPGAIGTSVTVGKVYEPPDMRRLLHDATVNYRIVRSGDPESWASGIVTAEDTVTEDALVSRLMDQIASRAGSQLRKPHPNTPE
jgi:hypothetical protein